MADNITFDYGEHGKVTLPIERCREVCPAETAAFELSIRELDASQARGDLSAVGEAGAKIAQRAEELKQALLREGRRREAENG